MSKLFAVAIAAIVSACALACGPLICPAVACDCASAITVSVTAPAGSTLTNLRVEGAQGTCDASGNTGSCHVGPGAGSYEFDVKADGFKTHHVSTTIDASGPGDECGCNCGYDGKLLEVALVAE